MRQPMVTDIQCSAFCLLPPHSHCYAFFRTMDPLSLLTGIPDLIERCIQGYDLFQGIKNAPKACSELMEELKVARTRLEELQEYGSRVEDKEKVKLSTSVENYVTTLDKLDATLKVYGDPKFKFNIKRRAKWVWSGEKKIKALRDDLKQNSGLLQPLLVTIKKDIDDMKKRQQEADTKKAAEELRKASKELTERLQKVVKWLEPLNSEAKLRKVRERRQSETCEWLREHGRFVSWYSSGSTFLWLNGIPGNGKTVLASFTIDHLKDHVTHEEIVLFAFADFQDVRSTDIVVLLRTLLAQILERYKPEDFVKDFGELETSMHQYHADPPKSVNYLIQLLKNASAPWKRIFVVLDALDECVQENRREYIAAIHDLASASSKFSIFVTSRGEQDILDVLSGAPTISLVDETQKVQDDIQRFIEDKMNTSYLSLTHFHESVRTRITSTLLEKSKGMFRLVDCQLESLAKAKFEKDIDNILRNLPTDLNSMYERILQSVEGEGQGAVQIVQRMLWWLVGSHRQLRLTELMEAVMVETGRGSPNTDLKPLSGEHLLEMCSSLIRYDVKTDILVLSHASVQDFLFSDHLKRTAHHSNFHIPSFSFLRRHTTSLILAYLHYEDFQNGPCTTEQQFLERLEQHPFLVYVVSNWDVHILKTYETGPESDEPPDFNKLITLFNDSEKNQLAQRSRRQVSYFGTDLRGATKDGSSKLVWQSLDDNDDYYFERKIFYFGRESMKYFREYRAQRYDLCEDIGSFVRPRHCAGPSWVATDEGLLQNHPWRDLSNTTSIEELDYMVYPLVSEGPASLVRDLLHKLPQFKERPLFYFGTPLMISISTGKLDTVKILLQEFQVDVNTCARHHDCNYEVVSPIFLATKYGHVEVVKQLLDCGSDTVFPPEPWPQSFPEHEPEDGHCDIIIGAADHGRVDILKVLLDHGVDVNTRSSISGNTALHVAVRYGRIDSVKVLIDAGCDISPCSKGKTPLDLALNQQSSEIVRYLFEKGASFDQCLPQNFEDLGWAVGEPWYPEMRQYPMTLSGGGPKSQQDIEKIVRLLEKRLSSPKQHIVRAILDFAELWIVNSVERHEPVDIWDGSPRKPYISTTPIAGSPENPVRCIVFTTLSHGEQGWHTEHAGGLYSGSYTWFEAGVESSPSMFMRIQDNVHADKQIRTHVNVWDYQDALSSIKEWMAKIKPGDTISVYPRVGMPGWANYVESIKITVYTSYI
ncbi:uncharacterized protein EV420DRAFT_738406 [Desarmillaria tabescens]|uniref:Nephrocystin 3-like N-terminal domain-containing protein n=1 Tax=Armillaria tabescens TaxID=1929756 RepID=A0AA39JX38_ARMTA|nr:uncharacterized protein EV420DRAFT_738406 [Desarmillaria tabescens]KAK0450531.1 hypothetical protein EV420DRAFT_738406 [Desarmillaria tabescens]